MERPPLEELRASFRRSSARGCNPAAVRVSRPGRAPRAGQDGKTMPTPMTTRHILVGHDALLFFYAKEILRAFPRTAAAAHAARRVDVKMMLHRALRMSGDAGASRFSLQNIFRPERFAFPSIRPVVPRKTRSSAHFRAIARPVPPPRAITFQGQNAPGGVRRRNGSRNAAWAPPLPVRKESASCQGRRPLPHGLQDLPGAHPSVCPTVFPF